MGSMRTGDINCRTYAEDRDPVMKSNGVSDFGKVSVDVSDVKHRRSSSQSPEYVKRTAKLFETIKVTEEKVLRNGVETKTSTETIFSSHPVKNGTDAGKISLDCLDGEVNKKPSYLGVSCSNSGYRNVINYDSKLREGFWSANSQRESLVLCNSRLRESSPLRLDLDFKYNGGTAAPDQESIKLIRNIQHSGEGVGAANGVSKADKFVNISTSTKTISTFRNAKDVESKMNGAGESSPRQTANVNLKQILNGKSERRGYSSLGLSHKTLKSPEKNCNSFLKSINSFERNCKGGVPSSNYLRTDKAICDSNNSIQQRIERLYGPGALAQGFYAQKSSSNTKLGDKPEEYPSDGLPQRHTVKISLDNLQPNVSSLIKTTAVPAAPSTEPENASNGVPAEKPETEDDTEGEKNGLYFLKLLKKETDRLERLAGSAESELENGENLPEEVSGKLRAAAGKARLLVSQKLHQFEGLCQKNLNEKPTDQFRTTSEDLAGFWDMVMLQVVQVYGVFDELEQLKKNNWKAGPTETETPSPAANGQSPVVRTSRKSTPISNNSGTEKQSEKAEAAKKKREENRKKMLEDRRRKMKELKENRVESEVEIFAK